MGGGGGGGGGGVTIMEFRGHGFNLIVLSMRCFPSSAINTKFEYANRFYPCQSICVATSAM